MDEEEEAEREEVWVVVVVVGLLHAAAACCCRDVAGSLRLDGLSHFVPRARGAAGSRLAIARASIDD